MLPWTKTVVLLKLVARVLMPIVVAVRFVIRANPTAATPLPRPTPLVFGLKRVWPTEIPAVLVTVNTFVVVPASPVATIGTAPLPPPSVTAPVPNFVKLPLPAMMAEME